MKVWVLASICVILPVVYGHGRLLTPPGRSTAWRFDHNTPHNYNDHELNCGGFSNQWGANGGKCGLCGDPYQGPRENEAGGKYATGTIVKRYSAGNVIEVTVQITSNHQGYHEFRLCEHNDPSTKITQECLDEHLLPDATTGETRHYMNPILPTDYTYKLRLPAGVTCTQCVLQWKYNAGNSWGVDAENPGGCIGCGDQEQFYGCADVSISGGDQGSTSPSTPSTPPSTSPTTPSVSSTASPTTPSTVSPTTPSTTRRTTTVPSGGQNCVPTETYEGVANMVEWCNVNCAVGNCPATHCICQEKAIAITGCRPLKPWKKVAGMAGWCQRHCPGLKPACDRTCTCN